MTPTNHHGANNELAESTKEAAQRCRDVGVAQTEAHVAAAPGQFCLRTCFPLFCPQQVRNASGSDWDLLRGSDLEKDRPDGKRLSQSAEFCLSYLTTRRMLARFRPGRGSTTHRNIVIDDALRLGNAYAKDS